MNVKIVVVLLKLIVRGRFRAAVPVETVIHL